MYSLRIALAQRRPKGQCILTSLGLANIPVAQIKQIRLRQGDMGDRNIKIDNGNYNEKIEGDYIQSNKVDHSQVVKSDRFYH